MRRLGIIHTATRASQCRSVLTTWFHAWYVYELRLMTNLTHSFSTDSRSTYWPDGAPSTIGGCPRDSCLQLGMFLLVGSAFKVTDLSVKWTECLHGVLSSCGTNCPTSFPAPCALGASFNMELVRTFEQDLAITENLLLSTPDS